MSFSCAVTYALLLIIAGQVHPTQADYLTAPAPAPSPSEALPSGAGPPPWPDSPPGVKAAETDLLFTGITSLGACDDLLKVFLNLLDSGNIFFRNPMCYVQSKADRVQNLLPDKSTAQEGAGVFYLSVKLQNLDVAVRAIRKMGRSQGADIDTFLLSAGVPCGSLLVATTTTEDQESASVYTFSCNGLLATQEGSVLLALPGLCCSAAQPPRSTNPSETTDQQPPPEEEVLEPPPQPPAAPQVALPSPPLRPTTSGSVERPQLTLFVMAAPHTVYCAKLLTACETMAQPYQFTTGNYTCRSSDDPGLPTPRYGATVQLLTGAAAGTSAAAGLDTLPSSTGGSSLAPLSTAYVIVTALWPQRAFDRSFRSLKGSLPSSVEVFASLGLVPCGTEIRAVLLTSAGKVSREDAFTCASTAPKNYSAQLSGLGLRLIHRQLLCCRPPPRPPPVPRPPPAPAPPPYTPLLPPPAPAPWPNGFPTPGGGGPLAPGEVWDGAPPSGPGMLPAGTLASSPTGLSRQLVTVIAVLVAAVTVATAAVMFVVYRRRHHAAGPMARSLPAVLRCADGAGPDPDDRLDGPVGGQGSSDWYGIMPFATKQEAGLLAMGIKAQAGLGLGDEGSIRGHTQLVSVPSSGSSSEGTLSGSAAATGSRNSLSGAASERSLPLGPSVAGPTMAAGPEADGAVGGHLTGFAGRDAALLSRAGGGPGAHTMSGGGGGGGGEGGDSVVAFVRTLQPPQSATHQPLPCSPPPPSPPPPQHKQQQQSPTATITTSTRNPLYQQERQGARSPAPALATTLEVLAAVAATKAAATPPSPAAGPAVKGLGTDDMALPPGESGFGVMDVFRDAAFNLCLSTTTSAAPSACGVVQTAAADLGRFSWTIRHPAGSVESAGAGGPRAPGPDSVPPRRPAGALPPLPGPQPSDQLRPGSQGQPRSLARQSCPPGAAPPAAAQRRHPGPPSHQQQQLRPLVLGESPRELRGGGGPYGGAALPIFPAREVTLLELFNQSPLVGAMLSTPPTSTGGALPSPLGPQPSIGILSGALSRFQAGGGPGSINTGRERAGPAVALERLSVQLAANIARLSNTAAQLDSAREERVAVERARSMGQGRVRLPAGQLQAAGEEGVSDETSGLQGRSRSSAAEEDVSEAAVAAGGRGGWQGGLASGSHTHVRRRRMVSAEGLEGAEQCPSESGCKLDSPGGGRPVAGSREALGRLESSSGGSSSDGAPPTRSSRETVATTIARSNSEDGGPSAAASLREAMAAGAGSSSPSSQFCSPVVVAAAAAGQRERRSSQRLPAPAAGQGQGKGSQPPPSSSVDISPKELRIQTDGLLGAGAFGSVYRGSYRGQPVAIKVLHHLHFAAAAAGGPAGAGALLQQKDVDAFRQEIAILRMLAHPNIVRVLGGCAHAGHPFLVMELLPRCLHNVIHGVNGRLSLAEALRIATDIARGLAHLHPAIVHRDLKPANILLDAQGTAKISDFGLARYHLKPYISTQQPDAGSVAYMAPEGFDPAIGRLSAKCDVYSFGVLLWELLTQEHPWGGESNVAIIYRVAVHRMRLPLPSDPRACPPRLAALLDACMSYRPADRPDMRHVLAELQDMLQTVAMYGVEALVGQQQPQASNGRGAEAGEAASVQAV